MGLLLLVSFLNSFTFVHIFMILCTEPAFLQYQVPAAEPDKREFQILKVLEGHIWQIRFSPFAFKAMELLKHRLVELPSLSTGRTLEFN